MEHTPATLSEAFYAFSYFGMESLSPITQKGYRQDIKLLLDDLAEHHVTRLDQLDISLLQSYLDSPSTHYQQETQHRKAGAIKAFLRYLYTEQLLSADFANVLIWPEHSNKRRRKLTEEEYRAIYEAAKDNPRDRAILSILHETNIRVSQLIALTYPDSIDLFETPDESGNYGILFVRGKHRTLRKYPLTKEAVDAIRGYLTIRPKATYPTLFLTRLKKAPTARSIQQLFKRYAILAEIAPASVSMLR